MAELHAQYGFNEVKPKTTPEWRKILARYLDWVSLVIVSHREAVVGWGWGLWDKTRCVWGAGHACVYCMLQASEALRRQACSPPSNLLLYCHGATMQGLPPLSASVRPQIAAAVVSAAVPLEGKRGWTSFTLLVSLLCALHACLWACAAHAACLLGRLPRTLPAFWDGGRAAADIACLLGWRQGQQQAQRIFSQIADSLPTRLHSHPAAASPLAAA